MTAPSALLQPGGPIAEALAAAGTSFESRPQQAGMAAAVARALEERSQLLVEAGTGTGKSFAYLVPAILRCLLFGERVVVATNTIALQEQLMAKDVPLLHRTVTRWGLEGLAGSDPAERLRPVLVKGRGNYLSLRRLELASRKQLSLLPDAPSRQTLHQIEDWAYTTTDGSLATLGPLERPAVWDRVQSDAGNCMGAKCPQHQRCFYQRARRQMEEGNLLVCNHALFFADLALRAQGVALLPDYDHVILDEAHGIEDVASEHFGRSLTEGRVGHLLGLLHQPHGGKGYLLTLRLGEASGLGAVEGALDLVARAQDAARQMFADLARLARRMEASGGRVPVPEAVENPLTPAMRELALRLKGLREAAAEEEDRFELQSYAARAAVIADDAEALVTQSLPGSVYWVESTDADQDPAGGRGAPRRGPRVRLACAPVEVAPLLQKHLFAPGKGIVLTSATLATRQIDPEEHPERAETAFAHLKSRLGCGEAAGLQFDSPFDYARQAELIVDATMPSPRGAAGSDPAYIEALSDRIVRHVRRTEGGAFVLFTSFAALFAAADACADRLASLRLPLLVQGRGGSRSHLLERFRADASSVLFGAASFWQGVDVRGSALRNVIIARLPFDPPDRPLTQARLDLIKQRGGNPFMEESLPRAVIRFKQGFGRLIRSATDTGQVVVLDPRLVTARYGRAFVEALPPGIAVNLIEE